MRGGTRATPPQLEVVLICVKRDSAIYLALLFFLLVHDCAAQEQGASQVVAPQKHPGFAVGVLPALTWKPEYQKFGLVDAALTGTFVALGVTSRILGPRTNGPQGGVWVDEGVRNALRASSEQGRARAGATSDVLVAVSFSYAFVGEPLVNGAWLRQSPEVGAQIALLNSEVIALTFGVQQLTANWVARERPYGRECASAELPVKSEPCQKSERYRSFFSGHTSLPFSLAAATCTHNSFLPLNGRQGWVPCVLGIALAATTGALRIVADNHYATDVFVGAGAGSLIGFLVPFLHYTTGTKAALGQGTKLALRVFPTPQGVQVLGSF